MIAAAGALGLAVLVLPWAPRNRLVVAGLSAARRSMPPAWLRVVGMVAVALVAVALSPRHMVIAGGMVCGTVALRLRGRMRRRRAEQESRSLQTALDVLVRELRAGAHPVAAFCGAAAEADDRVKPALQAVAARAELGADVSAGLRAVAVDSALPAQWHQLAVCWELAQTHGLSMATLMRTAQRDVVQRARFSARVDAGMAGARATAAILAVLPLAGVALGQLIGAQPMRFLLFTEVGGWLLMLGVGLACAGLLWSDRITGAACR